MIPPTAATAFLRLRRRLSCHQNDADSIGEIARLLHGGECPRRLASIGSAVFETTRGLMRGDPLSLYPIFAAFTPPPGGMWLEVDGSYGLLVVNLNGLIRIVHVDVPPEGEPYCYPVSLALTPHAAQPDVDWEAVGRGDWRVAPDEGKRWLDWLRHHLHLVEAQGGPPQGSPEFLTQEQCALDDLVVLSVASSPLFLGRLRETPIQMGDMQPRRRRLHRVR